MKLDRPEQALEAFESASAPPPGRDALLDYYHGLAAYEARLYLRADRCFARAAEKAGPRIAEQAARIRADIAAMMRAAPGRDAVDWYLARCDELAAAGRRGLARAHCEEARDLGGRRADRHGVAAAAARLERMGAATAEAR